MVHRLLWLWTTQAHSNFDIFLCYFRLKFKKNSDYLFMTLSSLCSHFFVVKLCISWFKLSRKFAAACDAYNTFFGSHVFQLCIQIMHRTKRRYCFADISQTKPVQVIEAKNLAKKDIFGASDPYVRIDLVSLDVSYYAFRCVASL